MISLSPPPSIKPRQQSSDGLPAWLWRLLLPTGFANIIPTPQFSYTIALRPHQGMIKSRAVICMFTGPCERSVAIPALSGPAPSAARSPRHYAPRDDQPGTRGPSSFARLLHLPRPTIRAAHSANRSASGGPQIPAVESLVRIGSAAPANRRGRAGASSAPAAPAYPPGESARTSRRPKPPEPVARPR